MVTSQTSMRLMPSGRRSLLAPQGGAWAFEAMSMNVPTRLEENAFTSRARRSRSSTLSPVSVPHESAGHERLWSASVRPEA